VSFGDEMVPAMPGMSTADIERIADEFCAVLDIHQSNGAAAIDWPHLIDVTLPTLGIHVSPVDPAEIDGDEGATDPGGTGPINVLLRQDIYDGLWIKGPQGNRARATAPHELSHCALHVARIRRFRDHVSSGVLLRRVRRATLAAFVDPEWQAWTMAGCLVAPRRLLTPMLHMSAPTIARQFGISVGFLEQHLRRLKLAAGQW
jgi:hypothetical protein